MTIQVKRINLFSLGLIALGVVSGCSTTPPTFNDSNVHFKLLNHQSLNGNEVYTIQISSTSPLKLTHLTMYLSYPIITPNGTESNPFLLEGRTNNQIVTLEDGQSVQFTFDAPVKQVFGNSKLLDFKHPSIELDGFTKDGNKEVPFEMGGDLRVFLSQK